MVDELVFRVTFSVILFVWLANLGWVRYSARKYNEQLGRGQAPKRERRWHEVALAIFGPLWFGGIALYTMAPGWIAFLSIPLPDWLRLVMAAVSVLSSVFTIWGYRALGRNWVHALDPSQFQSRKTESLVTTGPYSVVRNPIYLGAFTLIIALAFLAANLLLLLPALFLVTVIYRQIDGEEAMLKERFGDEYLEYMKRTPRIVPRLRRRSRGR